jgi:Wzt-like putative exopolysaccharide export protein
VRVEDVVLLGPEGEPRSQFLAGEPLTLRLRVAGKRPQSSLRISFELRDSTGLLVAGSGHSLDELGTVRFDVEHLPLADGRFRLRLGLTDESGERVFHWLDDALEFIVYPAGDERGVVRLAGEWSGEEIGAQAERVGT